MQKHPPQPRGSPQISILIKRFVDSVVHFPMFYIQCPVQQTKMFFCNIVWLCPNELRRCYMWWKSVFLWIQCTNKNNIITKTERFKLNDSYYSKKSRPDVKVHKINEVNILKTINLNWKIKIESSFNFCAVFPIYYYDFDLSWEKPILPNSLQILQKKYTTKHMMKFWTATKKKMQTQHKK